MTGIASGEHRRERWLAIAVAGAAGASSCAVGRDGGERAGEAAGDWSTITVDTLPIANALPLDLGIKKGFFEAAGDRDQEDRRCRAATTSCSRSPNDNGDDRLPRLRADDDRAHAGDPAHGSSRRARSRAPRGGQLAEHPRQGLELDPDACRPRRQDDRRQRAQGRRRGDDQGGAEEGRRRSELGQAPRAAVPGDADGAQQRPGRRDLDAGAVPLAGAQPRRRPDRDGAGARCSASFWPIGGYARAATTGSRANPGLAAKFRTAINQSLAYAQAHPDEIRALLPAATRNVRLPIWSPLVDRAKLRAAREVHEGVRRHLDAAEPGRARPEHDPERQDAPGCRR